MNSDVQQSETQSLVGREIDGKYRVLERLGGGGMGAVYKAEHVMMGRIVAIKVLHRHLAQGAGDGEFFKRFQREARTSCQIEHPNVVTLYDFGIYEEQPYIVMNFNRGRTLKAVIAREGKLSALRAFTIVKQICLALSNAHKLGIIHRDLKPDNVMLTQEEDGERVQVLDFGLAKVLEDPEDGNFDVTKTGIIMGTPRYMAPEQALGGPLDARSDIYALGIMLYECLTGEVPFTAESPMQLMLKHIKEKPKSIKSRRPDVTEEEELLCLKSIKKEPRNRFQDVGEMVQAINEILGSNSLAGVNAKALQKHVAGLSQNGSAPNSHEKVKVSNSKGYLWTAVAAVGIVCLLGVTGFAGTYAWKYYSPEQVEKRAAEQEMRAEVKQHLGLAEGFFQQENYQAALYELDRALELDVDNAKIQMQRGTALANLYQLDEAILAFQSALDMDSRLYKAHYALGNIYYKQGRLDDAALEYENTLKLKPRHSLARKNLKLVEETLQGR